MMNNRQMPPEQSAHLCTGSGRLAGASFKSPSTFQFLPGERSDPVRPIEVNAPPIPVPSPSTRNLHWQPLRAPRHPSLRSRVVPVCTSKYSTLKATDTALVSTRLMGTIGRRGVLFKLYVYVPSASPETIIEITHCARRATVTVTLTQSLGCGASEARGLGGPRSSR
jgi:hypothetical protein